MDWEEAEPLIYAAVSSGWTGPELFFEGQTLPDLTKRVTPFATVTVMPSTARQSGLAPAPPLRQRGSLEVVLFSPKTKGAKGQFAALDRLVSVFTATVIGGSLIFVNATILALTEGKGWKSRTFLASLYFDS